jgi:DNA-3-methyladenine glycosylase I
MSTSSTTNDSVNRRYADGLVRCSWATSAPEYLVYHDEEWGQPVHDDAALYERLTLESFQSGLSWLTILRKRENFRAAFEGFDPVVVAKYGGREIDRLMGDASIVRNRKKIEAAITNARAINALDMRLSELLWSFAPSHQIAAPESTADLPASSPESTAMAKQLKALGFVFLGPTTCYALMQATGMVNDHVVGCWRR